MLIEATSDLATRITGAIRDAARATGASFDYLLKTTLRESNLNPGAKAPTSSATGLVQFIDQTWLGTLKRSGAELGYGNFADPEPVPLPRPRLRGSRTAHQAWRPLKLPARVISRSTCSSSCGRKWGEGRAPGLTSVNKS